MKQDVTGVNDTLTDCLWYIHARLGSGGYNIVTVVNDHLTDNIKISLVQSCITLRVIYHT